MKNVAEVVKQFLEVLEQWGAAAKYNWWNRWKQSVLCEKSWEVLRTALQAHRRMLDDDDDSESERGAPDAARRSPVRGEAPDRDENLELDEAEPDGQSDYTSSYSSDSDYSKSGETDRDDDGDKLAWETPAHVEQERIPSPCPQEKKGGRGIEGRTGAAEGKAAAASPKKEETPAHVEQERIPSRSPPKKKSGKDIEGCRGAAAASSKKEDQDMHRRNNVDGDKPAPPATWQGATPAAGSSSSTQLGEAAEAGEKQEEENPSPCGKKQPQIKSRTRGDGEAAPAAAEEKAAGAGADKDKKEKKKEKKEKKKKKKKEEKEKKIAKEVIEGAGGAGNSLPENGGAGMQREPLPSQEAAFMAAKEEIPDYDPEGRSISIDAGNGRSRKVPDAKPRRAEQGQEKDRSRSRGRDHARQGPGARRSEQDQEKDRSRSRDRDRRGRRSRPRSPERGRWDRSRGGYEARRSKTPRRPEAGRAPRTHGRPRQEWRRDGKSEGRGKGHEDSKHRPWHRYGTVEGQNDQRRDRGGRGDSPRSRCPGGVSLVPPRPQPKRMPQKSSSSKAISC